MIVRITFEKDGETWVMLFGNSYKAWHSQMVEYVGRYFCDRAKGWNKQEMLGHIRRVEVSKSKWKGFGGLKWCSHENFQEELNREGVQDGEPNNPKPREYAKMRFEDKDIAFAESYLESY